MRRASVSLALLLVAGGASAADRGDTAGIFSEPSADLADLFAWMSPDAQRLNLVLTVFPGAGPGAGFSDAVQYVFHLESRPRFAGAPGASTEVLCRFTVDQTVSCWLGDDVFVTGDASASEGIEDASGAVRVFAGARDDPFFFNESGFRTVRDRLGSFTSITVADAAGCPAFDLGTSQLLANQLATAPGGDPPVDAFERGRVLALVISIDRSLVTQDGPLVSVWASTHRALVSP